MAQLIVYLDKATEAKVRNAAKAAGVSVSRWVLRLIREKTADEWPKNVRAMSGSWNEAAPAEELRAEVPEDPPRERF